MVKINGEEKALAGQNLLAYLQEAGFEPERVVVERNLEIVPKEQLAQVVIQDEDVIEVCGLSEEADQDDRNTERDAKSDLAGGAGPGI